MRTCGFHSMTTTGVMILACMIGPLSGCSQDTAGISVSSAPAGAELGLVTGVEMQPLRAQVRRLFDTLEYLGQPLLTDHERRIVRSALSRTYARDALTVVQKVLDRHCLAGVHINPESRVKVARGPAPADLVEQGWRTFLVKVHNEGGVAATLAAASPNARNVYEPDPKGRHDVAGTITPTDIEDRWMDIHMVDSRPMMPTLSGLPLEYRVIQVFARDPGRWEGTLAFNVGQGTQDIGFRNETAILFHVEPSVELTLRVLDHDGSPAMASFIFRDGQRRVYPSQSKRLSPDFFFHPQIYREDGETITLPPGTYTVEYTRGPEYHNDVKTVTISAGDVEPVETFQLRRWIRLADLNWYSGDHHVHGAGCAHYADPTQGVGPEAMMRHILGEDLNVGCVLSWGPCWYHQKQFFDGKVHELSTEQHIMRYDVEVSGFPSDYAGHLCLLGLNEDDYPQATKVEDWPSWDLPILQWGKSQGAVVGFSHSGWGLHTKSTELPNYEIPPFDGIGANEYIVDVTHDAVDFISAADTPWPFEMNIWYHTNNAGFRTRISGETDFPCIYGERVGLGRGYVKIDGPLDFGRWLEGVKAGRSYVSDGRAHLINFTAGGVELGVNGSELRLGQPQTIAVTLTASAFLAEVLDDIVRQRPIDQQPYWHVERARIGESRRVAVEIVVNGLMVASREIEADGSLHDLEFSVPVDHSSWIAARVFASAHTNPIYVTVGGAPILASKKSIQWCLDSVDRCWKSKSTVWKARFVVDPERDAVEAAKRSAEYEACRAAYEHAREIYRRRLAECTIDDSASHPEPSGP